MSVLKRSEEALRLHQHKLGILCGGPNLYPAVAARIVCEEWEGMVRDLIRVAEKPQEDWDWKDVQVIEIVKDELDGEI